jgi:excisionase family DNA binding protein
MLTVPEAAERAGFNPETIRRWIRSGRLIATKVGTQHVIDEHDLERALGERAPGGHAAMAHEAPVRYELGRTTRRRRDDDLAARITLDPSVLTGKPVVRGTRIPVQLVLDLLAAGWSTAEIVENYPALTAEDIRACIAYAAEQMRTERVYRVPAG